MSAAYGNNGGAFDLKQQPPQAYYGGVAANPYPAPQPAVIVVQQGAPPPRTDLLPCCGIGIGWTLFILGFFLGIPWYVGAVLLCCLSKHPREKAGCIACLVLAVIATIVIAISVAVTVNGTSSASAHNKF